MEKRWWRLVPKEKGLETLILNLTEEEAKDYRDYGYVAEPVVVMAQSAWDALQQSKAKGKVK